MKPIIVRGIVTIIYYFNIPAVPGTERRSKVKLMTVYVGKRALSVRILMHNTNEPLPSSVEVNICSNPTVITENRHH